MREIAKSDVWDSVNRDDFDGLEEDGEASASETPLETASLEEAT